MGDFRSLTARRDPQEIEAVLAEDMGALYADPLGFLYYAYEWGKGELEGYDGPDEWQKGFFREWGEEIRKRDFDGRTPVDPQLFTTTSGHGVGKSASVGWAVDFIMSTRPFCKGMVTANTSTQLNTKTWAEIAKWTKRCITSHWFKITSGPSAMKLVHKRHPETWRCDGVAWREGAPEAFAGQHAPTSTSFYFMDEASGIPRSIWETAMGGMVTGEPMMFAYSNPTQNKGFFFDTHQVEKVARRWKRYRVDSRTAKMANHKLHEQWIADYGLDSDFVRVRVLGLFPKQASAQFIPGDMVEAAQKREPVASPTEPLILGVDVARFGDDNSVLAYRRGRDARSIPRRKLLGYDSVQLAAIIGEEYRTRRPDAIIVDGGGNGGPVVDILRHMKIPNVHEVNFGGQSPDADYRYMNGYMMAKARDWLRDGGSLWDDEDIRMQLTSRNYFFTPENKIMLEPKEAIKLELGQSPDDADAFCLTFGRTIGPRSLADTALEMSGGSVVGDQVGDYNPFAH